MTDEQLVDELFKMESSNTIKYTDGHTEYRVNNILHREDGPAIIDQYGNHYWFLNGIQYTAPEKMPITLFMAKCKHEILSNL